MQLEPSRQRVLDRPMDDFGHWTTVIGGRDEIDDEIAATGSLPQGNEMTRHELRVMALGSLAITLDGRHLDELSVEKHRALLAYLALEPGRFHSRVHLASLFWPEVSEERSKSSLRQALYRIRRSADTSAEASTGDAGASDSIFVANRHSVGFVTPAAVSCDVVTFRELVQRTSAHHHVDLASCSTCLDLLRQAAGLYRGDLLAGCSPDDAPGFDEWLLLQREILQNLALRTFDQLVEAYQTNGQYDDATHMAFRSITIDQFREASHRSVMRMLALQGLGDRALGHYDGFYKLLGDELGVEPDDETIELADQIRTGALTRDSMEVSGTLHTDNAASSRDDDALDPRHADPTSDMSQPTTSSALTQTTDRRGSVLVVDDTAANLQVLYSMLEEEGYQIRAAISGAIAIESIEAEAPDLILLDVMMPGMSGFEVCDLLKRDPRYCDIPIIFISALSDTPEKMTAFQAGAVDYITKPFQVEEVLARVNLHLKLQDLTDSLRHSNAALQQQVAGFSDVAPPPHG